MEKQIADDENRLGIALERGRIVVEFDKPTSRIGVGRREAIDIAAALIDAAMELAGAETQH